MSQERSQGNRSSRSSRSRDRRSSRRRGSRRRRVCEFCADQIESIDYKDARMLQQYVARSGSILPRRRTGTCAKHQRMLSRAIKRARHIALLSFTSGHART